MLWNKDYPYNCPIDGMEYLQLGLLVDSVFFAQSLVRFVYVVINVFVHQYKSLMVGIQNNKI